MTNLAAVVTKRWSQRWPVTEGMAYELLMRQAYAHQAMVQLLAQREIHPL